MAKRPTRDAASLPAPWAQMEAGQLELEDYVSARLGKSVEHDRDLDAVPVEPDWVGEAMAAAWPQLLAEAELARC